MAEDTPALARLDARVDSIAGDVGKLTHAVDRFVEKTDKRFDRADEKGAEALQRVEDKLATLIVGSARPNPTERWVEPSQSAATATESLKERYAGYFITIAIAAIGGFLTYVHGNIESSITDNKTSVHDVAALVATQNKTMLDLATATNKMISDQAVVTNKMINDQATNLTAAIGASGERARTELSDVIKGLVPRPELDSRINANKAELDRKVDVAVFAKAADMRDDQIHALREGEARLEQELSDLRAQSASKAELAGLNERYTTLSNRLSGFSEKFTAVPKDPRLQ